MPRKSGDAPRMPSSHRRVTRIAPADAESDRRGRRVPARRRSRRDADRNGLRPGGRRDLGRGGRGDLRRQGTAGVQSADRPFRRSARAPSARRSSIRFAKKTGARVLAGAADASWRPSRRPAGSACWRAPGSTRSRCASPDAPDRARADRGGRGSARRALGQPLGARQPDAGRPRRRRSRRPDRLDPRRRPDAAGSGIDDRRLPRRAAASAAPRRDRQRANRSRIGRRACERRRRRRPADAPIAPGLLESHYAPRAALRLAARRATSEEAALDFGGALRASPARRRGSICRRPAISTRRPPTCSPICARSTRRARHASPSRRSPKAGSARRSTTACAAPPRRAKAGRRHRARATYRRGGRQTLLFLAYSTCAACMRSENVRAIAQPENGRSRDMNSALDWDEFRLVKAIADARSLVGAARGAESQSLDDFPSPRRHRERDRRAAVRAFAHRLSADRGGRGNDRAGDRDGRFDHRVRAPRRRPRRQAERRIARHHGRLLRDFACCRRSWRAFAPSIPASSST